ncbi:MAG: ketoacyl-ACP synthase III [Lachnospiraceae bacterium]|nr:ketoacyl-ACP synthase III [Lachnospiraceae bacterium]
MEVNIAGTGACVPERVLDNVELSAMVDTSDEWIRTRTGIARRYIATWETTVDLAAAAAEKALQNAGMEAEKIQMIIAASSSAEMTMPGVACMVQERIKAVNASCFDINAACSGFIAAFQTAQAMANAGMAGTVLIIGAERMSSLVDWKDRSTCVLFGDGAGAAVLTAGGGENNTAEKKMASVFHTDGTKGKYLNCRAGQVSSGPVLHTEDSEENPAENLREGCARMETTGAYLRMDGKEVFEFAVKKVPECIREVLKKAEVSIDDVDYFILHQANRRIIESAARRLGVDIRKFPMNMEAYGNMSSASIPILLDELNREGKLKPGLKLVLAGFGAGLTWGASYLVWTK